MSASNIGTSQSADQLAAAERLIEDGGALSLGSSAPRVFTSAALDFDLLRLLGMVGYRAAEVGEVLATARSIEGNDLESWTARWREIGDRVQNMAENCLGKGHAISARDAFLRASSYYLLAFFYLPDADPRKRELFHQHTAAFAAAAALHEPALERVSIPYDGRSLPGYFLPARNALGPRPTVLIMNGGDGTAEQIYSMGGGAAAMERGYHALIFDGPGQSGAYLRDSSLVYRPDWEVPMSAIVDFAIERPEVDPHRIALIAYSMGGNLGTRAMAYEKRLAAFAVSSIVPDLYPQFGKSLGVSEQLSAQGTEQALSDHQEYVVHELMPRFGYPGGLADIAPFLEYLKTFNIHGLETSITKPVLNISATSEGVSMYREAKAFFAGLPNPANRHILTGPGLGAEHHCQLGNPSLQSQLIFDWLDDVLAD